MRLLIALPLLLAAACSVETDDRNDQTTIRYDDSQVENAMSEVGNATGEAAEQIGDAAARAGDAIENGVGDIDVDLDVRRDAPGNSN